MDPVTESLANDKTWMGLFPGHWVEHGRVYQREGRVSLRKCGGAGRGSLHVTALVHGSRPRPYEIDVKLALDGFGDLDIEGRCTCALGYNCRHVLGALIQARQFLSKKSPGGEVDVGGHEALESAGSKANADSAAGRWVGSLASALSSRPPRRSARRLLFLLRPDPDSVLCRLHLASAKQLDNGGWGDTADLDWIAPDDERRPAYLSPGDVGIIREMRRLSSTPCAPGQGVRPDSAAWGPVIDDILASGRCHWVSPQSATFREGEARVATLGWRESQGGDPHPILKMDPPCEFFLGTSPLRFVDPQSNTVGFVDLEDSPAALAHAWVSAPEIYASEASEIATLLRSHPELRSAVPIPETRDIETRRGVVPTPILRLNKVNASARRKPAAAAKPLLGINVADLQFEYLGRRIPASDPSAHVQVIRSGGSRILQVERDRALENDRLAELIGCGFRRLDDLFTEAQVAEPYRGMLAFSQGKDKGHAVSSQEAWIGFVTGDAEDLKAEGWVVETEPGFEYQIVEPEAWFGEIEQPDAEGSGRIDWFEFSFGVEVGGRRINLLPTLVAYLASQEPGFDPKEIGADGATVPVRMEQDGRYINFPADRLRRILTTLAELYDPESLRDDILPIHALRAADLASKPFGDELFSSGRLKFQKLASRLAQSDGIRAASEPVGFQGELRPYQKEGYSWLQFLAENGLAGILADDMGLGKTVQMLCHLAAEKVSGRSGDLPSLIVAPTSVLTNWEREAGKFAPGLKVLVLHGASRKRYFDVIGTSDLVVTSYPLLVRDEHALARFRFHALVLDEAQLIKNPRSKAAQVASSMRAHHRVALTGTPVENHLGELWSIFNFLMPGFLGTEKTFQNHYRAPIEKDGDEDRQRELSSRVAPLMIRRTKRQVAKELPPKTEVVRQVPLEGDQAELYETVRAALDERLVEQIRESGIGSSGMLILDALLKLRQICCDPRLLKLTAAREVKKSAKMELLMEFVPQLVDAGHSVLIFSQFTSMLGLIGESLDAEGIPFVSLTGSTKDRGALVDRFQNGEVPVFLISLMAGGTGLNLTRADTVIHYDPWWNPAIEAQASDRAYRIGQKNPVFVYKLITEGTVEEKILHLQRRKSRLLQSIFASAEGGDGTSPKFSAEELKSLMAPMV